MTVVGVSLERSPAGKVAEIFVMWAAFYPFVTKTTLPLPRYWAMLVVGVAGRIGILLFAEEAVRAISPVLVPTIFLASAVGLLWKKWHSRSVQGSGSV